MYRTLFHNGFVGGVVPCNIAHKISASFFFSFSYNLFGVAQNPLFVLQNTTFVLL